MTDHERRIEMYPLRRRVLEVAHAERITPRMVRLHLAGPDLEGMRSDHFADHVKLWFPNEEGGHVLPVVEDDRCLNFRDPGVVYRDYTVRALHEDRLVIDFVAHDHGPAGRWAQAARPGDRIGVLGPRGTAWITGDFDYHVLLVDETALPAAARYIEELPSDARVFAFLEVADAAEEQKLDAPAGARITWLHRGDAQPGSTDLLLEAFRALELPQGDGFVYAAGEADTLKPIRRLLKERGFVRNATCEVDGYWRRGTTNLDHHQEEDD
ncbi:siderophore-interacting protein [Nocardiopsis algeriensis]|uniref:NADPH-dependent ferric siderophore reductase n=1 Tax=Nocardiopsis algeriensis TaxID=1478215 RepID=A0A841IVB8_9ACTN|nr:siderophore-interacting protein [Nocardiopsis algeriensis]MBB6122112.1 NADPH-dependent ferric siderophore reductase [Nocardiopsis algeriensis]